MYYLLWLDGHTIVQTCFCCLYLQDPQRLKKMPIFGAFADAFLIVLRKAMDTIIEAGVYDDEDFLPAMFGVNLEACAFSNTPAEVFKRLKNEREKLSKLSE